MVRIAVHWPNEAGAIDTDLQRQMPIYEIAG